MAKRGDTVQIIDKKTNKIVFTGYFWAYKSAVGMFNAHHCLRTYTFDSGNYSYYVAENFDSELFKCKVIKKVTQQDKDEIQSHMMEKIHWNK